MIAHSQKKLQEQEKSLMMDEQCNTDVDETEAKNVKEKGSDSAGNLKMINSH